MLCRHLTSSDTKNDVIWKQICRMSLSYQSELNLTNESYSQWQKVTSGAERGGKQQMADCSNPVLRQAGKVWSPRPGMQMMYKCCATQNRSILGITMISKWSTATHCSCWTWWFAVLDRTWQTAGKQITCIK